MKARSLLVAASFAFIWTPALAGGDANAGKAKFEEESCDRCHYEDDFAEDAKSVIKAMLQSVKSGETKHRVSLAELSDEDIANLAAYFASQ